MFLPFEKWEGTRSGRFGDVMVMSHLNIHGRGLTLELLDTPLTARALLARYDGRSAFFFLALLAPVAL